MKYKLLCVDMDGTMLNSDKVVTERTIDAIRKASEKGVRVVICTGRQFTSAEFYADLIGIKSPIISANGAYIREKDRNEVIYKSILGKENCKRILAVLRQHGLCPNFHTPELILTDKADTPYMSFMKFNTNAPGNQKIKIELVDDWETIFTKYEEDIVKCIVVCEDFSTIKEAKEEMASIDGLEVVSSYVNNFEIMVKGVSKGRAVEILAGYYNISRDEVICIGDNENDYSMIEYAGLGVAMGNSEAIIKDIADYITDSNNDEGVAKVIEKFIISQ